MLVLSPKDGARARARSVRVLDYEHEHHFIEHEHESDTKDVGKDEASLDIAYVCYHISSALAKHSWGRFFSNFAGLAHNAPLPIDARRR